MATKPFDSPERPGRVLVLAAAAATTLYAGVIGAADVAGRAVPAADTAGLRVVGRVEFDVFNGGGAAGDLSAQIKRGCFRWANSAVNALTVADIGKWAYVENDTTVASTSVNKVKAGRVVAVDANGVWIDTASLAQAAPVAVVLASTNGTAAAASANLANLAAETEKVGDDVRAIYAALVAQGILS